VRFGSAQPHTSGTRPEGTSCLSSIVLAFDAVAPEDQSDFVPIPRQEGSEYLLRKSEAGAALSLHHHVLIYTARTKTPDFVPDELIAQFTLNPKQTIDELRRAKMWKKVKGGYRVLDSAAVERAVQNGNLESEMRIICEEQGHIPTAHWGVFTPEGHSRMCVRCHTIF
jgi:hypothetical protein